MTTATLASRLVCTGCGAEALDAPERGEYPFRCANATRGDDTDHIVARVLDPSIAFPADHEPNPFIRYRRLFHSYHLAVGRGMSDTEYVDLVRALDAEIARVDGHGFTATPFAVDASLTARVGSAGVWVKNETGNVSGSHKARHLMGIAMYLRVVGALDGLAPGPLAIASCGNAALAAAVVARAAGRELQVFIPPDAPAAIVRRLEDLRATPIICRREPGTKGDPCYLRFEQAVEDGAIPFCCQGSANGLTIEGGETLGYEMVAAAGSSTLDAVVVQVGGGALASSVVQAFADAQALGACTRLPRVYTVQTRGAFPLERAYDRFVARHRTADLQVRLADLHYAATHRHEFMWPWEEEPRSIARGILDDETYDWLAIVKGMIGTGGRPVVVEESDLADAYTLARATTGINVDHTGAAGLAGLMRLVRDGEIGAHEQVAVIFSGVER